MKCMKLKRFLGKERRFAWYNWNADETDALHRGLTRIFLTTKDTKVNLTTKTLRKITKSTKALRFVVEEIKFGFLPQKT